MTHSGVWTLDDPRTRHLTRVPDTNPQELSTGAVASSVISSVIALPKPANRREPMRADDRIRKR